MITFNRLGILLVLASVCLSTMQAQSHFTALEPFESITLNQGVDITLVASERYGVAYEGSAELELAQLGIQHNGNGIMLNRQGEEGPDMIYVYAPGVKAIMISGSGNVYHKGTLRVAEMAITISGVGDISLSVEAQKLALMINGKGDIMLEGQANTANITINGGGDVNGRHFYAQEAYVVTNGKGDVSISVDQKLVGTISGHGDINYWGNPEVIRAIAGAGDLLKRGQGSRAE